MNGNKKPNLARNEWTLVCWMHKPAQKISTQIAQTHTRNQYDDQMEGEETKKKQMPQTERLARQFNHYM